MIEDKLSEVNNNFVTANEENIYLAVTGLKMNGFMPYYCTDWSRNNWGRKDLSLLPEDLKELR
jgi:hypothetical protein